MTGSAYLSYDAARRVLEPDPDAYVDIKAMQLLRSYGQMSVRNHLTKKTISKLIPDLVMREGRWRLKR